jgi:hypothetical protein
VRQGENQAALGEKQRVVERAGRGAWVWALAWAYRPSVSG